jgi:undecaprenyl-phosphate 4-deoxy-4-formamido-L-arabinose transferase
LPILIKRLANVLPQITNDYEVILINDGSKDKSWEIIVRLKSQYPFIVGINFSKNFGQHNAILCGIRAARKELVVTMDDDLQHPPEEIHKLIYKLIEGYDVVYGMPRKGPHTIWRNLASRVTKRTLAFVMGMKNVEEISSFRVFRSKFKLAFDRYDDPGVIVDVLLSWGTSNFASIIVEENPRDIGVSNYTFTKLIHQTILILTGFSTVPLRLASWMGFLFTLFGIAIFLFVLISYLSMGSIPGFPFLASIIAIFSGAQLFALGLIGEYLARISDRSMGRPAYIIESTTEDSSKNKFLSIEEPHH